MGTDDDGAPRVAARRVRHSVRSLALEAQNYVDAVSRRLGHHRSDMSAVGVLLEAASEGRSLTPGELARRINLSAAAVTALVDRLQRTGHAVRHPHATDRRRVVLDPTALAAEVSARLFKPLNAAHGEVLTAYSDDELDLVARVLDELTEATRRASVGDASGPDGDGTDEWGERRG